MKKLFAFVLAAVMLMSMVCCASAMTAGTYTKTVNAMNGPMTIEVTLSETAIESVAVTDHVETPGIGSLAIEKISAAIVENQSVSVDVLSGATVTSRVLMSTVTSIIKEAGADAAEFSKPIEATPAEDVELTADVVIVGGGGAGLAAAVSATEAGASVVLLEKSGLLGGNSLVSGGIYNTPDANLQANATNYPTVGSLVEAAIAEEPVSEAHAALIADVKAEYEAFKQTGKPLFDSANWYALQTWNGGDKLANLDMVKTLAANAYDSYTWLESMGMDFLERITLGAGSLYPRTHSANSPNGSGYINCFTNVLATRENYTQLMNTKGTELIVEDGKVVGVIAEKKDGSKVTVKANNGVILATGGFAGNVELRQQYCEGEKWPDLGAKLPTSNLASVTGDGIFMAQAAGAALINMEQIQLLPYCHPVTGMLNDNTAVGAEGIFVNKEGKRFVREDGRRDVMANGIIAQTDGVMYLMFSSDLCGAAETAATLDGQTVKYYLDNNLSGYVSADTVAELAEKIGVPADALEATVAEYNKHFASGEPDEFGRVSFPAAIENGPFYAYPRKPAAHHTMGGVNVDTETHALNADGEIIDGLYCAGEITGNLHGTNRLGGNAIVDFCVFGRIAGANAAANK